MKRISLLIATALLSLSCTSLQRSPSSGYSAQSARGMDDGDGTLLDDKEVRNLTPEEREQYEESTLLRRLEAVITTSEERAQYNRFKTTMESDRERIEFLTLDGYSARERYLTNKGYTEAPNRHPRDVASLIEQNDIAIGMGRKAVLESWGDPAQVEVAGRPENGNERWLYSEYVSTPEGYQEEKRVLYFQNGKLVGWEKY